MAELGQPKNTIDIIKKYDFRFRKKFGQNFLIDEHVLRKILKAAELTKDDAVLEIGPGIGCLTAELSRRAGKVLAVELDKALIEAGATRIRPILMTTMTTNLRRFRPLKDIINLKTL